jgi:hypothetical protein
LGKVFRKLAEQMENRIEEGHPLPDRAHMMNRDSAQVCGVASDWVYQKEERDPSVRAYGEKEELREPALLGARVLRVHRGAR